MWTKEEHIKYAARRKPTIRMELSLEDRDYLVDIIRNHAILYKTDIERNNRIIQRLLNKKSRVR